MKEISTQENLEQLIHQGESEILEFKKSTTQLKAACETLCAFLNGQGGHVLLGVTDGGKVVGQTVSDNTKREIAKELAKIEPAPVVNVSYISINDNLQVIILSAPKGQHFPYVYDGRAFQRSQSTTAKMSQHRYEQLLIERGQLNYSWEEGEATGYTLDDLDHEEIKRTVNIAVNVNRLSPDALSESVEETLTNLELIKEGNLTNAAVVLFAKSVASEFSHCLIKLARFRGTTETEGFIDNQMVYGNAFQIMKAANEFTMRHLPVAGFFDESSWERIDKPLLPVLAIREALSNAICHRDYAVHNGSITFAIYDDRLEIWNNGVLPSTLTIEDLKKQHKSHPRNKRMAKVFYLRRYIETWGTGTTKMIRLCQESDVPEPVFEEYSGGFSVTFKYKDTIGSAGISNNQAILTHRQEEIINLLQENSNGLTSAQIVENLSDSSGQRTVQRDLAFLEEAGIVQREGEGRLISWKLSK